MPKIEFIIPVNPVPKGRPRFGNKHGYTPKETKDFENVVGLYANRAMMGLEVIKTDIQICVEFHLPDHVNSRKIDLDNLFKALTDGMNKIVYKDDRQIMKVTMSKDYTNNPGIEILICWGE